MTRPSLAPVRLRELELALDVVGSGHGAIVWTGEPGSGRTAILDLASQAVRGLAADHPPTVRWAAPTPRSCPPAPGALVAQLLGGGAETPGVLDVTSRAMAGEATSLAELLRATAGGTSAEGPVSPTTEAALEDGAGAGRTEGEGPRRGTLVLVVDDLDLADEPSRRALLAVATQRGGSVVLLATATAPGVTRAARSPAASPPDWAGTGALVRTLDPLGPEAALHVLRSAVHVPVAPWVAADLARRVEGNLSCLLETAAALTADQLAGRSLLPDPLAPVPSLRLCLGDAWDGLDDESRRVLLVAAVSVLDRTDLLLAATGITVERLIETPLSDHLSLVSGRFGFRDQRLRALVHGEASLAERTRAHAALASAHDRLGSAETATWHMALSTLEGDPDLVQPLLESAERHARGGRSVRAQHVAREAASHAAGPDRARACALAGRAAADAGHLADAARWLQEACASDDEDVVAEARESLKTLRALTDDGDTGDAEASTIAWAAVGHLGESAEAQGSALLLGRGIGIGLTHMDARWDETPTRTPSPVDAARLRIVEALLELATGDLAAAAAVLRDAAVGTPLALPLGGLGVVLTRHVDVARDGEVGEVGQALEAVAVQPHSATLRIGRLVERSLLATLEGRHEEAATLLEHGGITGSGDPGPASSLLAPDLVESWALAGRPESAEAAAERLAASLGSSPGPAGRVRLTRARLAAAGGADTSVLRALADAASAAARELGSTFEQGRTALVAAGALARSGLQPEAEAHRISAHAFLAASGADAWARLAGPDRAAAPEAPPQASGRGSQGRSLDGASWTRSLTGREVDVVSLAAAGRSNREIAERLFLSVRTVEVHLGRAYRKLGVRSRVELILRLGERRE